MKTAEQFVVWLKGLLDGVAGTVLTPEQNQKIRVELNEVFVHEIDPSMGDEEHQRALDDIHNPPQFRPHTGREDFRMKC